MLNKREINRYQRHLDLDKVGKSGQEKLKKARVLVVGVGGLGCPAIQYLAAAGVGTLGLMDHDLVDETNLQRQVLFSSNDIGRNKAKCAREKVIAVNPYIRVTAYPEKLTLKNALGLFSEYDIILDGTDNFRSKYLINDASLLSGKVMVSASVFKYEGQVSVFNYKDGPSYRCLFPEQEVSSIYGCRETGVLGVLPGIMGTLQATEVMKIILGIGTVLSGKLKVVNALTMEDQLIDFERNEHEIGRVLCEGLKAFDEDLEIDSLEMCIRNTIYVDVREKHELPKFREVNPINIPLSTLHERFDEIPRDKEVIVFCQSGKRSAHAVRFLKQKHGFENLINLKGGIEALKKRRP